MRKALHARLHVTRRGDGTLTALAAILALFLVLAACGGSTGEASVDQASETPASAQASSDTSQAEPAPAQSAPNTPQAEPTPDATASGDQTGVAGHLREKTMRMWEAYNSHDLDKLKPFYEESYWKSEEEELRSNMRPFKTFGITIKAEETSPPTEIAPGKWEIRHTGRFTMGSVNMVFIYEKFGEDWLLTYAEDE